MKAKHLLILFTIIVHLGKAQSVNWTQLINCPNSGVGSPASFSINGKGYWVGGNKINGITNEVWEYDPNTQIWTQRTSLPSAKSGATSFVLNNKAYVVGGNDNLMYCYDPILDTWNLKSPYPNTSTYSLFSFTIGNRAFVGTGDLNGNTSNNVYEYNDLNNSWIQKSNFGGGKRHTSSYFSDNQFGYVGLGVTNWNNPLNNDLWKYDPINDSWSQMASMPAVGRYATCAFYYNNQAFFIGGEKLSPTTNLNEVWIYNIPTNTWSAGPAYLGGNVHAASSFVIGNIGYVGGGGYGYRNDFYSLQSNFCTSNTITPDGPTTFCAGNYVNLTSDVVGGTYQWKKNGVNITTNGTSRTYKATATGSYTCEATCNGTALTSNAISVTSKTNAFASVSASGATSFCAGDSVTLNCTNLGSNYSVQWYRTNISMENATAYSQVVKQPGTYKVVTKNLTTGCSRISGSSVVVAVNCRLANPDVIAAEITESDFAAKGINEEPKGKIYIYPNPTSDNKFTVELMGLEVDGAATLEVYNAMGQILSSEKVNITNGTLNRTIQIDEQSKGQLCLVRLIAGSEMYDSKVILK